MKTFEQLKTWKRQSGRIEKMEQRPRPTRKPKRNLRRGCDHGPHWLHFLSIFALLLGFATAVVIIIEEARHPHAMLIMNIVWPVVALFGTALTIWAISAIDRSQSWTWQRG